MTLLYSNGCSYTANLKLNRDQRYPVLIGNALGWEVEDCAIPGSCNSRIIRCTIRDCINLLNTNKKIVALVQLTHVMRTEYAGTHTEFNSWKYGKNDLFESVRPNQSNDLPIYIQDWCRLTFNVMDEKAETSKLLSDIVGLINFFKQHNIDYFVFSGPQMIADCITDDFNLYLQQDNCVIDLKNFNMLSLTGSTAHPDINGMQKIADFFIEKLTNLPDQCN